MNLTAVVMKDELKDIKPKNGNYIINLESSSQGSGTHWIALFIQDKNCFYFDSFGIICPTEVTNFCKRISNSKLGYNDLQIQDIAAETCGWFAIGLLIHLDRTKKDIYTSAADYIGHFSYNSKNNNKILQEYFRHLSGSKGLKLLSKLYSQK
jgi:hypothetical protein